MIESIVQQFIFMQKIDEDAFKNENKYIKGKL